MRPSFLEDFLFWRNISTGGNIRHQLLIWWNNLDKRKELIRWKEKVFWLVPYYFPLSFLRSLSCLLPSASLLLFPISAPAQLSVHLFFLISCVACHFFQLSLIGSADVCSSSSLFVSSLIGLCLNRRGWFECCRGTHQDHRDMEINRSESKQRRQVIG